MIYSCKCYSRYNKFYKNCICWFKVDSFSAYVLNNIIYIYIRKQLNRVINELFRNFSIMVYPCMIDFKLKKFYKKYISLFKVASFFE